MSPIRSSLLLGAGDAAAGGFQVSRSLRFNSADSAYLSRNFSSGNQKIWTWSAWIKRGKLGSEFRFFDARSGGLQQYIKFNSSDNLRVLDSNGTLITSQVFRDPSAWYHVLVAFDTTQSTASNRIKLYVNGSRVTAFSSESYPTQNSDILFNSAVTHSISWSAGTTEYFDGYLANIHFIDGQQLDPSSFTEVSATTGQLIPKAYSGTYGTNGFYLKFDDNSTTAALGTDSSGNGNTWTTNNFSVTAGAGNDSLVDSPTSYGTSTGVGGEVRGNYCTLNPLDIIVGNGVSSVNGNLDVTLANASIKGTVAIPVAGKWYFEVTITRLYSSAFGGFIGIVKSGTSSWSGVYSTTGVDVPGIYKNSSRVEAIAGVAVNDIFGVAVNMDSMTLQIYKNNTAFGSSVSIDAATYLPYIGGNGNNTGDGGQFVANFGQRAFAYTAPTNYQPIVDTLLPAPSVAKPNTLMDVALYTGTGAAQSITGLAFNPDFVWLKRRSSAQAHYLYDVIRGTSSVLYSDGTDAEQSISTGLTSFNSDGFSLGSLSGVNASSSTYVGWAWDAGTTTVSNTAGSITSQVRANASAGFSVVTYTGNGTAGATIGHGLGVAPGLIIIKERSQGTGGWITYHSSIGATGALYLNLTAAVTTASGFFNNTAPASTVFSLGNSGELNDSGQTNVAYCFAPVSGYSSFGSYVGNGSSDGPMVWTGHRSRWILIKRTDAADDWNIFDTARSTYNVMGHDLLANRSDSEYTGTYIDCLSNGFKIRETNSSRNASGGTYIYAAFAESPFQYARAR